MSDDFFNIDNIISSKESFASFVYTPIDRAISEIQERQNDSELERIVRSYLSVPLPIPLQAGPKAILFRQIFTPNYEFLRFRSLLDAYEITPLLWEYHDDKFTPNNPMKRFWAKIPIYRGIGKKGGSKIEYHTIIDFNKSNGRKIRNVETVWGQPLVHYHHKLLKNAAPELVQHLYDASEWFNMNKGSAKDYYRDYVALFIKNGILFENFFLYGDDLDFTKDIFLPAFIDVYKATGKKPLVVALEPTEIEDDIFWMTYPPLLVKNLYARKSYPKIYRLFYILSRNIKKILRCVS